MDKSDSELPSRAMLSRRIVLAALGTICGSAVFADESPIATAVRLEVERAGARFRIAADAQVFCPLEVLWDTLVDYERLPRFVPDMESSQVLERRGDKLTVRQAGEAGWGPFKQRFELIMAVTEFPRKKLSATAIAGDLSFFESSYSLQALGEQRTRIDYVAVVEPKNFVPPFAGTALMRASMRKQFEALVTEAQRRAGPKRPQGTPIAPSPI